jgi:hypothetical protein
MTAEVCAQLIIECAGKTGTEAHGSLSWEAGEAGVVLTTSRPALVARALRRAGSKATEYAVLRYADGSAEYAVRFADGVFRGLEYALKVIGEEVGVAADPEEDEQREAGGEATS